jgi:hypothetical protein
MENIKFTKLENIEAWDITSNGYDLGCATNFSDGHMATIKVVDFEKTVSANSFEALSEKVTAAVKECSEKNNTFADFMNDWRESLFASFGYTQDDLDAIAEGEAEAEDYLKFQPHGSGPSYSEIEANDRFWGSEAYDF